MIRSTHMILVAVDDMLFSSKIRAAAKAAGVELTFARTSAEILARSRELAPALVIFDLNSERADPIGTVADMKKDPALAGIRTVGFVSHVQTDIIQAARSAGVDDVMARSAFAAQLAEILASAGTTQP